ncbi:hypothetical protein ACQP2F_13705 [Actinoplanes sp. CA-030573]|uniref:hypothetical protein n=1 Tax=Actinoplanes sp. CA-030573 TaxID=3239898 RepID=UPI003D8AA43A
MDRPFGLFGVCSAWSNDVILLPAVSGVAAGFSSLKGGRGRRFKGHFRGGVFDASIFIVEY